MEIRTVGPAHAEALARFFEALKAHGMNQHFHPHPLTSDAAREKAAYSGKDSYFILLERGEILAYAMLRGWDEGYEVPSLGVAIHPDVQNLGFGRLMMDFLRAVALRRGAKKIRLRVYPDHQAAVALYRSLGYEMTREKDGPYLLGYLDLDRRQASGQ
jgi:ribosomal protein S18 acetylase RimI-like enzyme